MSGINWGTVAQIVEGAFGDNPNPSASTAPATGTTPSSTADNTASFWQIFANNLPALIGSGISLPGTTNTTVAPGSSVGTPGNPSKPASSGGISAALLNGGVFVALTLIIIVAIYAVIQPGTNVSLSSGMAETA